MPPMQHGEGWHPGDTFFLDANTHQAWSDVNRHSLGCSNRDREAPNAPDVLARSHLQMPSMAGILFGQGLCPQLGLSVLHQVKKGTWWGLLLSRGPGSKQRTFQPPTLQRAELGADPRGLRSFPSVSLCASVTRFVITVFTNTIHQSDSYFFSM